MGAVAGEAGVLAVVSDMAKILGKPPTILFEQLSGVNGGIGL
jgi:hypothetical protein